MKLRDNRLDRITEIKISKLDKSNAAGLVRREAQAFIRKCSPSVEDLYVFALQKLLIAEGNVHHRQTWRGLYDREAIAEAKFQHSGWHQITRKLTKVVGA
ncbi:hypothetical protein [Bradyrhizobium japonicum]|uniref:hypothetical protein n=1 Tax=Bradyrhizobium japonicum TaxID=375 RepID=UPI001BADAD91|nr:hypothetical protein [Bradyrhizobium japonicum]MBR0960906.1 hypothetical protein [Bradyrhizobium japonicum]